MPPPSRPPKTDEADLRAAEQLAQDYQKMTQQLSRAIVGQSEVSKQVMIALFCQGHCILVGVPGVAKTLMIASIAHLLSLKFGRIPFTPVLVREGILEMQRERGAARARQRPASASSIARHNSSGRNGFVT